MELSNVKTVQIGMPKKIGDNEIKKKKK